MGDPSIRQGVLLVAFLLAAPPVCAQVRRDTALVHRAVDLDHQGDRSAASEMLGAYLTTNPDDGEAWYHLGRFYLTDAAEWFVRGNRGDIPATVYLDLAATALDQAVRMEVDSAAMYRAMVELGRAMVSVEEVGWEAARSRDLWSAEAQVPAFIVELGTNLLNSCPEQGVLLTGNDIESLAAWSAVLAGRHRTDVLPVRTELIEQDNRYRERVTQALEVPDTLSARRALSQVYGRRPICLSPTVDSTLAPSGETMTFRLARIVGPFDVTPTGPLSITEFVKAEQAGHPLWTGEVRSTYLAAARHNTLLCTGLLAFTGERPPRSCGR